MGQQGPPGRKGEPGVDAERKQGMKGFKGEPGAPGNNSLPCKIYFISLYLK